MIAAARRIRPGRVRARGYDEATSSWSSRNPLTLTGFSGTSPPWARRARQRCAAVGLPGAVPPNGECGRRRRQPTPLPTATPIIPRSGLQHFMPTKNGNEAMVMLVLSMMRASAAAPASGPTPASRSFDVCDRGCARQSSAWWKALAGSAAATANNVIEDSNSGDRASQCDSAIRFRLPEPCACRVQASSGSDRRDHTSLVQQCDAIKHGHRGATARLGTRTTPSSRTPFSPPCRFHQNSSNNRRLGGDEDAGSKGSAVLVVGLCPKAGNCSWVSQSPRPRARTSRRGGGWEGAGENRKAAPPCDLNRIRRNRAAHGRSR